MLLHNIGGIILVEFKSLPLKVQLRSPLLSLLNDLFLGLEVVEPNDRPRYFALFWFGHQQPMGVIQSGGEGRICSPKS